MSSHRSSPGARKKGHLWLACIYLALAISTSSTSTISIGKPTAVFLETHLEDQVSVQDYWHAAVSFRKIGFTAHLLSPLTGVSRIHPDNLTEFVSALLITPRDALSMGNDIDMLAQYVSEGNGLIIAGQSASNEYEPWARSIVNDLTSKFGIEFQRDLVCDPNSPFLNDSRYPHWPMISNFADHEAARGVSLISYHSGCSLKLSGNATALAWTSDGAWSDLNGNHVLDGGESVGEKIVAAVSTYGRGRVACIGDNNLWSSRFLDGFDNNELLLSLLLWVSREVEEPELKVVAMDLQPEVKAEDDGNFSALVPIRIWNQGTSPAHNITIYLGSGEAELVEGNLTYSSIDPGERVDAEVAIRFAASNCKQIALSYQYFTPEGIPKPDFGGRLRTVWFEINNTLYHLPSIFGNHTEIAMGSPGGWGNYTAEEMEIWANVTMDLVAENRFQWEVLNHTDIVSKVGERYTIKGAHIRRNIIGLGDPDANHLSGYVADEGDLRIPGNLTQPGLPTSSFYGRVVGLEEMVTSMPRLVGNLSEWGYISLMCEEDFQEKSSNRLAVAGFDRKGMETALEVLWRILRGEMSEHEDELSGTFALFRGIYDDGGRLIDLEFY